MAKPIKHIAVLRFSALGDVAMTVPVLRSFTAQYPELKLTVVSRAFFEPLFDQIPNVSFFAADLNGRHKGFFGLLRLYGDLRKLNIDAIADLHHVLRSTVITTLFSLSGTRSAAVDKARAEKKALVRSENKIFKPLLTVVQRHANVFTELGFKFDLQKNFVPIQSLSEKVVALTGVKNQKWIGIAPFAKHESKVYPIDLMAQVVDLLAQYPFRIFFFGSGNSEVEILNELAGKHSNIVVVAGKLSFAEELQLISNLDAMLSMDSGNAHLAAIYGVQVVTLWGATHPYAGFAPYGQPFENAIVSDRSQYPLLPTSVYGNKKVQGYEDAMRTIPPEAVVAKILNVIG